MSEPSTVPRAARDDRPGRRSRRGPGRVRMLLDAEPGFEVVAEAGNTRDAARYVRGHHPDVLVLDSNAGRIRTRADPADQEEAPETRDRRADDAARPGVRPPGALVGRAGICDQGRRGRSSSSQAVRLAAERPALSQPPARCAAGREPADARPGDLSERELEILRLIALGHTNPEIAGQLSCRCARSRRIARTSTRSSISSTRAELVQLRARAPLIELPDAELTPACRRRQPHASGGAGQRRANGRSAAPGGDVTVPPANAARSACPVSPNPPVV